MTTITFMRWEQDGAGGEHGTATYFVGKPEEVTLTVATFRDAHMLCLCIESSIAQARLDARRGLLAEIVGKIGRIEP